MGVPNGIFKELYQDQSFGCWAAHFGSCWPHAGPPGLADHEGQRFMRRGPALTSPALTLGERSTFLDRISPATRTWGQQEKDWTDLVIGAVCSI